MEADLSELALACIGGCVGAVVAIFLAYVILMYSIAKGTS
jgi:hypothetical protein